MRFTAKTRERLDEKFLQRLTCSGGRTVARSDGHVITKISHIRRLPFFVTYGAPL